MKVVSRKFVVAAVTLHAVGRARPSLRGFAHRTLVARRDGSGQIVGLLPGAYEPRRHPAPTEGEEHRDIVELVPPEHVSG